MYCSSRAKESGVDAWVTSMSMHHYAGTHAEPDVQKEIIPSHTKVKHIEPLDHV